MGDFFQFFFSLFSFYQYLHLDIFSLDFFNQNIVNTKTYPNEYKIFFLFLKIIFQLERLAVLICEWIIELMVIALLFIQSPGQGYVFVAFQTYK